MRPVTRARLRRAWIWFEPVALGIAAGAVMGALFGLTYVYRTGGF